MMFRVITEELQHSAAADGTVWKCDILDRSRIKLTAIKCTKLQREWNPLTDQMLKQTKLQTNKRTKIKN